MSGETVTTGQAGKRWQGGRLPRAEVDRRIDRLLDIALDEFALSGFGGTNLDRLVDRSGVSKTTIYRRFGSKEGLFTALIHRSMEAVRSVLWALKLDVNDPLGTIERFVSAYTQVAVCHPMGRTLLQIAVAERRDFPHLGAMLLADAYEGIRPISDYFGRLMAEGVLRPGDPSEAAFDLQGLITQGFRVMVDDIAFVHRKGRAREIAERFLRGWS
ncbi:regulatory protein TetR [Sphingobium chlorophenolicum L-1]|uniref:Regulatory protein TetR n=1 Tax=Sphingobium chlorophenolicum L-1 TaxID=690566 RepID=F6F3X9_SPHCR|nr:TetR/AcrR family transcriptional regulator [Sphingobium chlorophenolicum]AEG51141.1 regulatory protein TetR [Sphingobium chlorophenolicum L-1]